MMPFFYLIGASPHSYAGWEDGVGVKSIKEEGVHVVFAARVPFIPAFHSDDFTRRTPTEERNRSIVGRQVRFINDLANISEQGATFDLRFVASPDANTCEISTVDIALLGKVFHQDQRSTEKLALNLWRKVRAHFPSEDPYNYPLEPIIDERDFQRCLEPIPLKDLKPSQIVEVRKYADHDPYTGERNLLGFFPHPFLPNLKYSALGGLMEAMARQEQTCVVSISLKPTKLFKGELMALMQMLNTYSAMTEEGEGWMKLHRQERLEDLFRTYWPLINQRNHLFTIKVQVIGQEEAPGDVVHALGSEFMDNTTDEPRLWSAESPGNRRDLETAVSNFKYLEHEMWGTNQSDARARRLRFLCPAYEAAGAFRLPIPPESGYLPGIQVRDEAFVLPSASWGSWNGKAASREERMVELGEIIHRGTRVGIPFYISLADLKRHTLVPGTTGSGKTNTCLHLLSQLWRKYRIPFLVLYPIDKPDYRLLMADRDVRDDLLIFTLGDETCSPFRFNPLYVPPGILLKTHISQLMRSFEAAFALWEPLPRVYRDALYRVYRAHGWDVVQGKGEDAQASTPTMADFYDYLVQAARELTEEYGDEAKGNIRQATEIRMRDLLQNSGSVINVAAEVSLADILRRPVVMELGRVGSSEDIALVMGFLLTGLVEELGSAQKNLPPTERNRQHITLVEEAHRLMSAGHGGGEFRADPRGKGGEDFSNILAEVRGFGEGIMIAEQIPTLLVTGAIGNTQTKIMHRLEDTTSFDLFGDILNLDQRQREYVRALDVGQVIVRDPAGQPVHVQVANYKDQFEYPDDRPRIDDSDESVKAFMEGRMALPAAIAWEPPLWGAPCRWCRVKCQYGSAVRQIPRPAIGEDAKPFGNAAFQGDWEAVRKVALDRVQKEGLTASPDAAYCYLARIAASPANDRRSNLEAYAHVRAALENFHQAP